MSLVEAYKAELDSYAVDLRNSLDSAKSSADQKEYEGLQSHINEVLGKANDIMKAMELEIRTCPSSERRLWTEKLRADKDKFAGFKTELTNSDFERQKANLIGGKSGDHRRRMIDANEKCVV